MTRLYFHDAATTVGGTLPSGEQSTLTPDVTWTGATTQRSMDTTIGAGQVTASMDSLGSTSVQFDFMRMFVSPLLSGAQTVGGGDFTLNLAGFEANAAANWSQQRVDCYVWRPTTGTKIGTVKTASNLQLGSEPGTSEEVITGAGLVSSSVSAADGDVIIVELWSQYQQSMATVYSRSLCYDGTTVNTTNAAAVSNHASFIEFAETLTFQGAGFDIGPARPHTPAMLPIACL